MRNNQLIANKIDYMFGSPIQKYVAITTVKLTSFIKGNHITHIKDKGNHLIHNVITCLHKNASYEVYVVGIISQTNKQHVHIYIL